LLQEVGIPTHILPEIVMPGAALGTLLGEYAAASGLQGATVFATAAHDTASAVAAAPGSGEDWCYISSGTWSLMGVEVDEPVIDARALAMNVTNEVGAGGKIRLLKNIAGLWLLQECRRSWAEDGQEFSYDELAALAASAPPFTAIIDPDAFLEPGGMPRKIAAFCAGAGQPCPQSVGELARIILESLALRYKQVLAGLEELTGRQLRTIHVVGGGSRNGLLNQLVADATRRTVVAGPAEATAAGNVLVQAIGSGAVRDLAQAREIVRLSFPVTVFEPGSAAGWEEAYNRFCTLTQRGRVS
jgi:rhamnulokinase